MRKQKFESTRKYGFEFLTIFIGVFAAFALDNWNENRKDHSTEVNILDEINRGLSQDIQDISLNESGHKSGLIAARYFGDVLLNEPCQDDSLDYHYYSLLRDFISVQNISGYETLKSKGLDVVRNDSLRTAILSLYENDYNSLRKLEEEYEELQFFRNYHKDFDNALVPNFILDHNGNLQGINRPLTISETEKKALLIHLWKIQTNRKFILTYYADVKKKILHLQGRLDEELKK